MSYDKLSLEDFGRELLHTGDLDPVYIGLEKVKQHVLPDTVERWLLAYWCCYHAGVASYFSTMGGSTYWGYMRDMAANEHLSPLGTRWPRGRERRHFRGQKAVEAIETLAHRFPMPEDAPRSLYAGVREVGAVSFSVIRERVLTWPQFGPWIAFKVGDMLERVLDVPIDFGESDVFFFDAPREAAELWTAKHFLLGDLPQGKAVAVVEACKWLQLKLAGEGAPPSGNRPVDVQEFETVLCKWKSHMNGHYPVGLDTRELLEALEPWARVSAVAHVMHDGLMEHTQGQYDARH